MGKCYLSTGIWSNWDVVQERDIMCNALQVTSLAGVAQILLSKYFHMAFGLVWFCGTY